MHFQYTVFGPLDEFHGFIQICYYECPHISGIYLESLLISEWPGVHEISTFIPNISKFLILDFTSFIVALCVFASHPNKRCPIAHWLSENIWNFSVILTSDLVVLFWMWFQVNFMTINSPNRMDPYELTGYFRSIGSVCPRRWIHAPAPQGPGFPKQDPSVNAMAVFSLQFSMIVAIISLDRASCVLDLVLDDPKFCQYSGLRLLGWSESVNVNSFSRLCRAIPVFEIISATCKFIFPNGDILCSVVSESINLSQLLLIYESSSFVIILAACLTASSSRLRSSGLTPASTSNASTPAVPGIPRHKAKPFLCIFSKEPQLPTCHTGAAYSSWGTTKALYSCNIQLVLIISVSLTFLKESSDLNAFLSTSSICFSNFNFSSNVTPRILGFELYFTSCCSITNLYFLASSSTWLSKENMQNSVLTILSFRHHFVAHLKISLKSSFRISINSGQSFPDIHTVPSSANLTLSLFTFLYQSAINRLNNSGEMTEPWGSPIAVLKSTPFTPLLILDLYVLIP